MSGALFESWVVGELYKSFINAGRTPRFFHYRDQRKQEVDLLIQEGVTLHPIEVKKAASVSRGDVQGMGQLRRRLARAADGLEDGPLYSIGTGCVICMDDRLSLLTEDDIAVPVWAI